MSRSRKWILAAALSVTLFGLGAFFFFRPLAESWVASNAPKFEGLASAQLGYRVEFPELSTRIRGFNPEIEVKGAKVLSPDGKPLFNVEKLNLEIDGIQSVLSLSVKVGSVDFKGVRGELGDSWRKMKANLAGDGAEGSSGGAFAGAGFGISVSDFDVKFQSRPDSVSRARFDRGEIDLGWGGAYQFSFSNLSVQDPFLSSEERSFDQASGKVVKKGAALSLQGVHLSSPAFDLTFDFTPDTEEVSLNVTRADLPVLIQSIPDGLEIDPIRAKLLSIVVRGETTRAEFKRDPVGVSTYRVSFSKAEIKPDLAWPAIKNAVGEVHSEKAESGDFEAKVESGQFEEFDLTHLKVSRSKGALAIVAPFQGGAQAVLSLFREESLPIHDSLSAFSEQAFPKGPLKGELELSVPASSPATPTPIESKTFGTLKIIDGNFEHVSSSLSFSQIQAVLPFAKSSMRLKSFKSKVGGASSGSGNSNEVEVTEKESRHWTLKGDLSGSLLEPYLRNEAGLKDLPFKWSLSGRLRFDGEYKAGAGSAGAGELKASSAPLIVGDAPYSELKLETLKLERKSENEWTLEIGFLPDLKVKVLSLAESLKVSLKGRLSQLDAEPFLKNEPEQSKSAAKSQKPTQTNLDWDLELGALSYKETRFESVKTQGKKTSDLFDSNFQSESVLGRLTVPLPFGKGTLKADFERVLLPSSPEADSAASSDAAPESAPEKAPEKAIDSSAPTLMGVLVSSLPSIDAKIGRFERGERKLGKLRVRGKQTGSQMIFEEFSLDAPTFQWVTDRSVCKFTSSEGENPETSLKGTLQFRGFEKRIQGSDRIGALMLDRGEMKLEGSWPMGPDQFSLAKLDGEIRGKIPSGRFEKVGSIAQTLINLLSKKYSDTRSGRLTFTDMSFRLKALEGFVLVDYLQALFGTVLVKIEGKSQVKTETLELEAGLTLGVSEIDPDAEETKAKWLKVPIKGTWKSPDVGTPSPF